MGQRPPNCSTARERIHAFGGVVIPAYKAARSNPGDSPVTTSKNQNANNIARRRHITVLFFSELTA